MDNCQLGEPCWTGFDNQTSSYLVRHLELDEKSMALVEPCLRTMAALTVPAFLDAYWVVGLWSSLLAHPDKEISLACNMNAKLAIEASCSVFPNESLLHT